MHNNIRTPTSRAGTQQPTGQRHYFASHDPEGPSKLSTTVVHTLADVMGTDVSETEFTLYDSIDPDALDRIFSTTDDGTPRHNGHIAFTVERYRVTVYSDGQIVVTPPESPAH